MANLLEQLQIIIPLTSFLILIILTSINVFWKIRRLFPKKVNCWFCNVNSSVPYDKSNSWDCQFCEQYNGFTTDGDYNKEIPAQRITKLNTSKNSSFTEIKCSKQPPSNGLCEHCNRNQELKMQQLASFTPNDNDNFDEEVEDFKNHLEQSYRLCPRCERVLKRTLTKVKNNILGSKLAQIGGGLKILDQHMNSKLSRISNKRICIAKFCYYGLIIISIINFISITKNVEISKDRIESVLSNKFSHGILILMFYVVAAKQTVITICSYLFNFSMITKITNYISVVSRLLYLTVTSNKINIFKEDINYDIKIDFLLQTIGIIFSVCLILTHQSKNLLQILVILLWNVGQYLPALKMHCGSYLNDVVLDCLMMVGSSLTILLLATHRSIMELEIPKTMKLGNNNSFHRIYSECNTDVSDDDGDLEIDLCHVSSSSLNRTFRKSPLSNRSVISLDTTKSVSPTTFTTSVLKNHYDQSSVFGMKSTNGSIYKSTNGSIYNSANGSVYKSSENISPGSVLNRSFCNTQSDFGSRNNINKTADSQIPVNKWSMFNHPYQTSVDSLDMNAIKLGPAQPIYPFQEQPILNPFSPELYEERPPSVCSIRQRNILTPSRLHMNNQLAASQSSWVAGGYWNTSPQKKIFQSPLPPLSVDFCPIFSRTSSQSSGFESHTSSIHNGGIDRNSRESSIGDEIERASVFSEPIFNNSNNQRNQLNNSIIESPSTWTHQPQPIYPVMSRPSEHMFATPNGINFINQRTPSVRNNNNINNGYHRNNGSPTKSVCSFSLSNKNLSQSNIPKGRLLKDWIVKNNSLRSE